jgi:hypothetical protein
MNIVLLLMAYGTMIRGLQSDGQMSSAASTASFGYDERDLIAW